MIKIIQPVRLSFRPLINVWPNDLLTVWRWVVVGAVNTIEDYMAEEGGFEPPRPFRA